MNCYFESEKYLLNCKSKTKQKQHQIQEKSKIRTMKIFDQKTLTISNNSSIGLIIIFVTDLLFQNNFVFFLSAYKK